jgi:hypothetical protein
MAVRYYRASENSWLRTGVGTVTQPPVADNVRIKRSGDKLYRGNQQWKFAGLNADTWFGCWLGEKAATTDAHLDRYFGELNPHSLTRIWVYGNSWDANELQHIVDAATQHEQYLLITLSDANADGTQCGSNKGSGYPSDAEPVLSHAQNVIGQFGGNPTIAIWEAINEGSTADSAKPWYRTMTDALKSLDPDALVCAGIGTWYDTDWQSGVNIHDLPSIDIIDFHEYDDNGGDVSQWASETANIANALGVPWFCGETGFGTDGSNLDSQELAAQRLDAEWTSYINYSPQCAGMLYWDFKWAHPTWHTVNLDTPMWQKCKTYRHAYNAA